MKKTLKRILLGTGCFVLALALIAGGFVLYSNLYKVPAQSPSIVNTTGLLRLLHGLEANLATSLQSPQEA